ncbi:unnamed protein product [Amaranthus hypochondriacus]
MGEKPKQLHVVFFPFMAHGHMIPILDIARLFTTRGVKTTIITTPVNLPIFTNALEHTKKAEGVSMINFEIFKFPPNLLPDGCENLNLAVKLSTMRNFVMAVRMLNEQLEKFLEKTRPNCLVADIFLPWTTECAGKINVPRLVFHGTSYFALCAEEIVRLYKPYKNVSTDEETIIIPSLAHEIKMSRLQISEYIMEEDTQFLNAVKAMKESELNSYGVIVNSFYDLEHDYADFFSKELGRSAWHIGPVSLYNRSIEDKAQRGGLQALKDEPECLKWLNSKQENSVIYICFGSVAKLTASQLLEIASGLEALEQDFIWVVKNEEEEKSQEWLPGFEQRMEGKGLIVRGWAPQLMILEHKAIGAFVTHCGWNSILESISAGVPMVTWPGGAEQFYNEQLVTVVLKVGVPIGAKKWSYVPNADDFVKRDALIKALGEVMEGDEAQERRNRAKMLKKMALKAVEKDGPSYSSLSALINELRNY